MNRLFKSLMLSIFILSNILTPLSYANLEDDLFKDTSLNKIQQEDIIEKSANSEPEDTESISENTNNNEDLNSEDLSKPENDIKVSEVVTSDDGCYTFDTDSQKITSYNCTDTSIEIPSKIKGVDVKIIGGGSNTWNGAFNNKGLTSVIIPNTVEEIEQYAFITNNLTSVTFGENVRIIGRQSFQSNNLKTVYIPNSVETIGMLAFAYNSSDIECTRSNVQYGNGVIGISLIDGKTYGGCVNTVRGYKVTYKDGNDIYETSVTTGIVENLPGTKEGYEFAGWYTDSDLSTPFDFTQSITADTTLYGKWNKIYNDGCYTFNEGTQTITAYNASCGTDIVIPSSLDNVEVKIIGESAFYNKGLTSVTIPDTVEKIYKNAFLNNSIASLQLGESVDEIGGSAFQGNQLQYVYIPNSVTKIYSLAFAYNQNPLVSCEYQGTTRGNGVIGISLIDGKTYGGCVSVIRGYNIAYIDSGTTLKTVITTGVVENYLLSPREGYLFDAWYKDQNYTEKFDFSSTQTNPITEDTTLYAKRDEIVRTDDGCYKFNKDKKTIIGFGGTGTCGSDIEIPSQINGVSVESIGGGAMNGSGAFFEAGLTSVKIPDSVKEIQDRAFLHNELNYVSLGNSIEKIGRHAFQRNKLETIYIPNSVTEIGNWAFSRNAVADIPCSTHSGNYGFGVVGVYLSGDNTHLFGKDTCLQFQQGYSVKYMDGNTLYREDVSTGSVKNIELTGKDYYDFSGWYLDNTFSSKFDFSTTITGNTTLYAYWDPIIYHITYELDGGINNPENPSTYTVESNNISLKAPTKARHSFIGWTNVDITTPTMSITIIGGSTGDKSYTANWNLNGYSGRGKTSPNNLDDEKETSSESNTKNNEDENSKNEEKSDSNKSDSNSNGNYDQELLDAYNRAVEQGLINSSFKDLLNEGELTRAELAKIAVKYVQMLGMEKKLDENVSYPDVNSSLLELENYIKLAYQYQIMGIHADGSKLTNFKPNKFVSRGEFATVFSRILHGFEYNINGSNFYEKHLEILKSEGILQDTNPARIEEKKWVILIMYRNQKNN